MSKNDKKANPKKPEKEVLNLEELLVDKSNKTIILDLNEIEFDNKDDEIDEIDDEKTEDISSRFNNSSSIIIEDKPELELDDLLEERTINNIERLNSNQDKTMLISIEDIIETPPAVEPEHLVEDDEIFQETLEGLSTTGNTFIKNIDKKISNSLASPKTVSSKKYNIDEKQDIENQDKNTIELSAEKLLDLLIYGKLEQFEEELKQLQENFDNNVVDLIKYMFEFYVKKDD